MNKEIREIAKGKLEQERFTGWLFMIIPPIIVIFLWIFGVIELWSILDKIIVTVISSIFIIFLGYFKIKNSNKKLRELGLK